ncbi:MAG TPA: carboxypeptidase-like regulatory domain-containing protein [Gemmatimonadaceae bacterium]|nr:carboxypeptidase-like regulatory domain-containing protein [Gemmatimonadaceae bacterium]
MNVPATVVSLVFVLSTTALADGRMFGTVSDAATRAPSAGAQVRIEGAALRRPLETSVDPAGGYSFTVPAGTYEVTYSAPASLPYRTRLVIRSNASIRANVELCPEAVECCFLVMNPPPSIDVGSAAQQPDLSPFLPGRRAWGEQAPSRPLVAPRRE